MVKTQFWYIWNGILNHVKEGFDIDYKVFMFYNFREIQILWEGDETYYVLTKIHFTKLTFVTQEGDAVHKKCRKRHIEKSNPWVYANQKSTELEPSVTRSRSRSRSYSRASVDRPFDFFTDCFMCEEQIFFESKNEVTGNYFFHQSDIFLAFCINYIFVIYSRFSSKCHLNSKL